MTKLARIIALLGAIIGADAAQADVICQDCAYIAPGRYLGGFSPGDTATFQGGATSATPVEESYVLDINATSDVVVRATTLQGVSIQIF